MSFCSNFPFSVYGLGYAWNITVLEINAGDSVQVLFEKPLSRENGQKG